MTMVHDVYSILGYDYANLGRIVVAELYDNLFLKSLKHYF